MFMEVLQMVVILLVLCVLVVPVGKYLVNIFSGERHLLPERLTYRLFGIDPNEEMSWKRYALALVLANGAFMLLGYVLLRLQSILPLNPLGLPPQDPDLAFNTIGSSIFAAAHEMKRKGVSSLIVTRGGTVVGIVHRLDLYADIEEIELS